MTSQPSNIRQFYVQYPPTTKFSPHLLWWNIICGLCNGKISFSDSINKPTCSKTQWKSACNLTKNIAPVFRNRIPNNFAIHVNCSINPKDEYLASIVFGARQLWGNITSRFCKGYRAHNLRRYLLKTWNRVPHYRTQQVNGAFACRNYEWDFQIGHFWCNVICGFWKIWDVFGLLW